jgi:hypothetical protein
MNLNLMLFLDKSVKLNYPPLPVKPDLSELSGRKEFRTGRLSQDRESQSEKKHLVDDTKYENLKMNFTTPVMNEDVQKPSNDVQDPEEPLLEKLTW